MRAATRDEILTTVGRWLTARAFSFDHLEALAGDVSPRRYVRVALEGGGAYIAALYPDDRRGDGERFVRASELLAARGVPVPGVLDWDAEAGVMLVEDVGERSVYDLARSGAPTEHHLREAVGVLGRLATVARAETEALNPPLDGAVFRKELEQSWELVLEPRGLGGESGELWSPLEALCETLSAAPRRPCHRDFMARNLLVDEAGRLTVIDHQDLRMGPRWYDLASLLNDSLYVAPSDERSHLEAAAVPEAELEDYHRAAAQRTLKIVGTFAAFARRGSPRHLPLIAPSLRAARRHLAALPETATAIARLAGSWELALEGEPEAF